MTYLFNKVDTGLKIHTEIDELPVNSFFLVLFLLQDEHVVVEELLQSFIGEVDTNLLKAVKLQSNEISEGYNKTLQFFTMTYLMYVNFTKPQSHYIRHFW